MILIVAFLFGVFIALTGSAFIVSPAGSVTAFGIDPSHMADLAVAPLAGVRSLVFGVLVAALAVQRQRVALGTALLLYAPVSAYDFTLAAKTLGAIGAWRHLVPGAISVILGLTLTVREAKWRNQS